MYGNLLIECLAGHKVTTYVIAGLEIKNSTGNSRGKNDKIDAKRIADYGVRFADKMKTYTFCDQTLTELKGLNTLRSQLVRIKAQLTLKPRTIIKNSKVNHSKKVRKYQ
ncbi:MAG: transposase [Saprospiraceae bacterium]|nr:transposase [Saprospiraceae bacterium]